MNSRLVEKGCKVISAGIPGMAKQFDLQGFTQHIQALSPPSPWSKEGQGRDTLTANSHGFTLPSPATPGLSCPPSFSKITGSSDSISQDVLQLQPWPAPSRPQEEALGRNAAILKQDSYLDDLPSSPFPGLLSSAIIQQG